MMKIERLLSITQDKKGNDISAVQYLTKDQINMLDRDRFRKSKSSKDRSRLETEIYIIFKEDFDDLENQMSENSSKIQSLEADIEDKNQTIKKLQDRLTAIDKDHQKEIEKIKQEDSAKVDELKEDLHEKDLEIEETKTKYERTIGNLKEDHQKEISHLKESHQKGIEGLKLFDEDKHMKISDHISEVSQLKDNQFKEDYHMKISDHEKALNRMRGNCLKLRVRENREYSSYIDELDNLGIISKLRNHDKEIIRQMRAYNKQTIDDKAIDVNFNLIDKK